MPFTREEFFNIFAAYNTAQSIAAVAVYPLALVALFFAWRSTDHSGRIVGAVLALMWGWVGVVYHGLYFSRINPMATAFAGAFLFQAGLFAFHAVTARGLEYGPRSPVRAIAGAVMAVYAMVAYPLIGLLVGERYPAMPLFGVAPCPLLIFTFGLLLWATCARWWLWVVPLLWSILGGSAFVVLSVPQDWALPASAVAVVLIFLFDRTAGRAPSRAFENAR